MNIQQQIEESIKGLDKDDSYTRFHYSAKLRRNHLEWLKHQQEIISQQSTEVLSLIDIISEARSIIAEIPFGGSKEGRPDYAHMITSDKVWRLRQILMVD